MKNIIFKTIKNFNNKINKIKINNYYFSMGDFFQEKKLKNGIYKIKISENQYLSFLLKNVEKKKQHLLINFTGAISNRNGLEGPFFSGKILSDALNTPILAFSDPTLDLDKEISLAWYAGNKEVLDLPFKIKSIIEHVAITLKLKPLIFGGSGGGYAALAQGRILDIDSDIFVWNPQTSIDKYSIQFIKKYCDVSGFENLKESRINYNLCFEKKKKKCRLLYMQNSSDWHVKAHMKPYLSNYNIKMEKDFFGSDENNNIYVYIDNWGEGHATPKKRIIIEILKGFLENRNISELVHDISKRRE